MSDDRTERQREWTWEWVYNKWEPIAYRTKQLVARVIEADTPFHPYGAGTELRFERLIEDGAWPHDREVVSVSFDYLGRLKGCSRHKVIQMEQGRSHADLCRMLRIDEKVAPDDPQ